MLCIQLFAVKENDKEPVIFYRTFGTIPKNLIEKGNNHLPSMFGYIMKDVFSAKKPHAETNWNKDLRKWTFAAGLHPVDSLQRSQGKL